MNDIHAEQWQMVEMKKQTNDAKQIKLQNEIDR